MTNVSTGYGSKSDLEKMILKLTQIDVAIRSPQYCNFVLRKLKEEGKRQSQLQIQLFLPELLLDSQFCADQTTLIDGVKTTRGDSGGPSVQRCVVQNRFDKFISIT